MAADSGFSLLYQSDGYVSVFESKFGPDGSIYAVVGHRSGTVDLAPDQSFADNRDIVENPSEMTIGTVVKYDAAGSLQWTHVLPNNLGAKDFEVFADSIQLISGVGTHPDAPEQNQPAEPTKGKGKKNLVPEPPVYDGYTARLDAESGAMQWARNLPDSNSSDLLQDADGNLFVSISPRVEASVGGVTLPVNHSHLMQFTSTGEVNETLSIAGLRNMRIDFDDAAADPTQWRIVGRGETDQNVVFPDGSAASIETEGVPETLFFSLERDGDLIWERSAVNAGGYSHVGEALVGRAGDLITRSAFASPTIPFVIDSDHAEGTISTTDAYQYIARFDRDGNLEDATQFGTPRSNGLSGAFISELRESTTGIVVGGTLAESTVILDQTFTTIDDRDGFLMEISDDLDEIHWSRQLTGALRSRVADIDMNAHGELLVAGVFRGETELLLGQSADTTTTEYDGFVTLFRPGDPIVRPIATDDAVTVDEDTSLDIAVLANDTTQNAGPLAPSLATAPQHGTAVVLASGEIQYIPDANFNGEDSFTYFVSDDLATSSTATVTVQVNALNDAPLAVADSFDIRNDAAEVIDLIANDIDIDGDSITALITQSPAHGNLLANPDGTFTYQADAGYVGTDQFHYRINDGELSSSEVMVTLQIDAPPAGSADDLYVAEIAFESRRRGRDHRAVVLIRRDSDADGVAETDDAVQSGVQVTVQFNGQSWTGTTDQNGWMATPWQRNLPAGSYQAEVTDLVLSASDHWNLDLGIGSGDDDLLPDATLLF